MNTIKMEIINKYITKLSKEQLKNRIKEICSNIVLLENIYNFGAFYNDYSRDFQDNSYKERQRLCLITTKLFKFYKEKFNEDLILTLKEQKEILEYKINLIKP